MHAQMFLVLNIREFVIFCKMCLHVVTFLYETIKISIYKPLVVSELDKLSVWNFWGSPDAGRFPNAPLSPQQGIVCCQARNICVCIELTCVNSSVCISSFCERSDPAHEAHQGESGRISCVCCTHTRTYAEWLMEKHHSKGQKEKATTSLSLPPLGF